MSIIQRIVANSRFQIKSFLYLLMPGGYGYIRQLRKYKDSNYDHNQEAHAVRAKHNSKQGWSEVLTEGVKQRAYSDYSEYVTHQVQKLNEMLKSKGGFSNRTIFTYRQTFFRRFRRLLSLLPPDAEIICLGARQGTEVEVLRDLGFHKAVGIDLNPGPDNPLVTQGDFMHMNNPDSSVDLIYSNCIDHAFDLDQFFREQARILKPEGYALFDFSLVEGGPFEAVSWKDETVPLKIMLNYFEQVIHLEREPQWMWILLKGKRFKSI